MSGSAQAEMEASDESIMPLDVSIDEDIRKQFMDLEDKIKDLTAERDKYKQCVFDQEQSIKDILDAKSNPEFQTENVLLREKVESLQKQVEMLQQQVDEQGQIIIDFCERKEELNPEQPVIEQPSLTDPCAICQEELKHIYILKCCHSFHRECVTKWLAEQGNCPVCRTPDG